uniref:Uncharacterized protein n=1 Tax=Anguilla anguilla TaxID=7936 RepID=A0A0E9XS75_ANGAN
MPSSQRPQLAHMQFLTTVNHNSKSFIFFSCFFFCWV